MLSKYFSSDQIEENELGGACSMFWGTGEVYTKFWWGNLSERDHLENPGLDGSTILKWIFRNWDGGGTWTGSIWLSIGTGGGHL